MPTLCFPALIGDAGDQAARRFIEFFTANIRNPNTRAAYARGHGFLRLVRAPRGRTSDRDPARARGRLRRGTHPLSFRASQGAATTPRCPRGPLGGDTSGARRAHPEPPEGRTGAEIAPAGNSMVIYKARGLGRFDLISSFY